MDTKFQFGLFLLAILFIAACTSDKVVPDNPYAAFGDTLSLSADDGLVLKAGSFAQLHRDVFAPTCANAGCHDGQFEPDFRQIESAYNTLVYHPIIKNDPGGNFSYRVLPFESANSVLWERLNRDIDGQSGIMPLALDPDSDWEENRDMYLRMIQEWIDKGAPDVFGNIAEEGKINPYVKGMQGFADNTTAALSRDGGNGAVLIPATVSDLSLWFSIQDDAANNQEILAKLYLTYEVDDFREINGISLSTGNQISGAGFEGEEAIFSHQASLQLADYEAGKRVFMHLRLRDPESGKFLWIPGADSPDYIKEIFSFKRF
ncbi:MAG: hypothetical protein R8P61_22675 [Bacteroidia bacterium]|nr:hypothetical protein [Bacteroidia bacterium]